MVGDIPFFGIAEDLMDEFIIWFGSLYETFNTTVTQLANNSFFGGFLDTFTKWLGLNPEETSLISMMLGAGLTAVIIHTLIVWVVRAIDHILPG